MSEKKSSKVSEKLESLCQQGCCEVNQLLKNAEKGNLEGLAEFTKKEIDQIIDELDQIMTVYDKTGKRDKDK